MNFSLVRHVTDDVNQKLYFINEWNQSLKIYFKNNEYGKDIESIIIGVICVSEKFDAFYQIKKPRYIKGKTESHDGIKVEIKNSFEFNIKLNYASILNSDIDKCKNLVASELIKSLENIGLFPKKIINFRKDQFKLDFEKYFKENNIL